MHLRPIEAVARDLLGEAGRRCPTIARLVRSIEQSNVIVYLHLTLPFGSVQGNETRFLGGNGGWRYMAVWIDQRQSAVDRIVMLGHELQHVVEVATAADVHDEAGMRRLFEKIGQGTPDKRHFETKAAQEIQIQILRELGGVTRR